jgi:hypothetical protein
MWRGIAQSVRIWRFTPRPTRVPPSILDPGQGVPGVPASRVKQPELETGHLCLAPALKENVRTYLHFPVHPHGVIKRHRTKVSSIEWPRRVASLRARRGAMCPSVQLCPSYRPRASFSFPWNWYACLFVGSKRPEHAADNRTQYRAETSRVHAAPMSKPTIWV